MECPAVKCVVVGDIAVGKTALLVTIAKNQFPEEYIPTIFENHAVIIQSQGKKYNLGFWDTAGQEEYDRIRPLSYPQTDVFIICYSTVDHETFKHAKTKWKNEITHHSPHVPYILVGMKTDLREEERTIIEMAEHNLMPLSYSNGVAAAEEINAFKYVECSAKKREGFQGLFDTIISASVLANSERMENANRRKTCFLM